MNELTIGQGRCHARPRSTEPQPPSGSAGITEGTESLVGPYALRRRLQDYVAAKEHGIGESRVSQWAATAGLARGGRAQADADALREGADADKNRGAEQVEAAGRQDG